jgi:hypothetical protein
MNRRRTVDRNRGCGGSGKLRTLLRPGIKQQYASRLKLFRLPGHDVQLRASDICRKTPGTTETVAILGRSVQLAFRISEDTIHSGMDSILASDART